MALRQDEALRELGPQAACYEDHADRANPSAAEIETEISEDAIAVHVGFLRDEDDLWPWSGLR